MPMMQLRATRPLCVGEEHTWIFPEGLGLRVLQPCYCGALRIKSVTTHLVEERLVQDFSSEPVTPPPVE